MKTENTAFSLIAEKLDALAGLPAGYAPNLESKWQLLETSLVEQRKSKRKILFILRAAAGLVLIAAMSLLFIRFENTATIAPNLTSSTPKAKHPAPVYKAPEPVLENTRIHYDNLRQARVEEKKLKIVIPTEEPLLRQEQESLPVIAQATSNADSIQQTPPVAKLHKKSKTRYIQMDFGESTDLAQSNKKAPVYTNSLQFKLRPTEQPREPEARETTQNKSFRIKF